MSCHNFATALRSGVERGKNFGVGGREAGMVLAVPPPPGQPFGLGGAVARMGRGLDDTPPGSDLFNPAPSTAGPVTFGTGGGASLSGMPMVGALGCGVVIAPGAASGPGSIHLGRAAAVRRFGWVRLSGAREPGAQLAGGGGFSARGIGASSGGLLHPVTFPPPSARGLRLEQAP